MTIGPDNYGNGVAKNDERFAAQLSGYRTGGRRDNIRAVAAESGADDVAPRNGGIDRGPSALDAAPIASSLATPKLVDPTLRDFDSLTEPVFPRDTWLDSPAGSLADHPLLRGLLMELPPKGAVPPPDWLDRWFEAARSILDLLYSMSARS